MLKIFNFLIIGTVFITGCSGGESGSGSNNTEAVPTSIKIIQMTDDKFIFLPDTGARSDKIIGSFDFTLTNEDSEGYIRDLTEANMLFLEREYGTEDKYLEEVEATQSSAIEKTPIDVVYLIDTSYSVVESNANEELIKQANALAESINENNDTTTSSKTRYRTFADAVGSLRTSFSDQPFEFVTFENKGGGTALYQAIHASLIDLSSSTQPLLFVFTDGRENASAAGYDLQLVTDTAKSYGIPIHIAGLGAVDIKALENIASQSGGKFYQAENVSELPSVFKKILENIPVKYTATYRPTQRTGHVEFKFVVDYYGVQDFVTDDFNVDSLLGN